VKVQRTLPSELSNAISSEKNQLQTFKTKGRKQAMTGQKAAKTEECNVSHA